MVRVPVDISKVQYRLIALLPNGGMLHLSGPDAAESDLILSATWEEQPEELSARLQLLLKNVKRADGWLHQHVAIGRRLVLQATDGSGWREVWRGQVYRHVTTTEQDHTIEVTAYDTLYPLQQSRAQRYYRSGETGASCIKDLAQRFGIPLGRIDGPNVKLPKKPYRGERIGSIIADRLEQTRKLGGGRWIVRDEKGRLSCVKEGSNETVYIINADVADNSEDEYSIEQLVTRVRIYGKEKKDKQPPLVATKDGRTEFGVFQEIVYATGESLAEAVKEAEEILRERGQPVVKPRVYAPDNPWIRKGDKVRVNVGTVNALCIVEGVTHNLNELKMTLQLRRI